jgi:membrane protein YdbS with pleckstrin-like domain
MMTSNPETPAEAPSPTEGDLPHDAAAEVVPPDGPAHVGPRSEASFDEGTFRGIPHPRRQGLLEDDGRWHQLAKRYLTVQLIVTGIWIAIVAAAGVIVTAISNSAWVWVPASVLLVILAITFAVTPRQVRAFGYRLRDDDLVLRRGILFQRVVAVPYGRMQLIDITHGPLDRAFGIAQLKLVTAAASSAVVLPGLTQTAAEQLRDTLIAVAETRRTGL